MLVIISELRPWKGKIRADDFSFWKTSTIVHINYSVFSVNENEVKIVLEINRLLFFTNSTDQKFHKIH